VNPTEIAPPQGQADQVYGKRDIQSGEQIQELSIEQVQVIDCVEPVRVAPAKLVVAQHPEASLGQRVEGGIPDVAWNGKAVNQDNRLSILWSGELVVGDTVGQFHKLAWRSGPRFCIEN